MGEPSEQELMAMWSNEVEKLNNQYQSNQREDNFVEITRLPKKVDAVSIFATN